MAFDVGIDIGSVSINGIVINDRGEVAWEAPYQRHFGLIREELGRFLDRLRERFAPSDLRSISFTGLHGERLAREYGAPFEVETIAQVVGAVHVVPGVRTIISIGGQDAALFQLTHDGGRWHLDAFNMNGPCASGTGSFIDQQAERLASSIYGERVELDQAHAQAVLEDFIQLGLGHSEPAPVACRCTVFTKSDMIHLQNKGEPLPNIVAGLHFGNAANYMSTIVGNRRLHDPVIFIGGAAANRLQVEAFRKYFPALTVPPHYTSLGALGAALQSQRQGRRNQIERVAAERLADVGEESFPRAAPLQLKLTRFRADPALDLELLDPSRSPDLFLGLDIGSTTTKYALIDRSGAILHKCYRQTRGKPIEVTQELLRTLDGEGGLGRRIVGIATTGSGRNVVGDFLDADLIIDEITAHAGGAVAVDPEVDTIFEIGGQDSKYIRIERGNPLDFDMNKVCAAGTGSFLHELANKLRINIVGEFETLALASRQPVALAERCTVFMESDLMSHAQKGAERSDLIAGLCYAIVHNYLNRVVGKRAIGERVMFLGGPSLNRGIVAAFEQVLGKPLLVPVHREVLGGYGAALALKAGFERGVFSRRERDLAALARAEIGFVESLCRADSKCHNECKLKVYDFCGRKSVWGGECARYEVTRGAAKPAPNLFAERHRLFRTALAAACAPDDSARQVRRSGADGVPTVGIPLAIHSLEWGILWANLFRRLGFSVAMTEPTNHRLVAAGVASMTAETCFPIKVFHGHVKELLDRVEYLFLPNVIDMPGGDPEERGLFCPLVESSQYMARAALSIADRRLIRPNLHLKEGPEGLSRSIERALPPSLRPSRAVIARAAAAAWAAQAEFRRELLAAGRQFLARRPAGTPLWVVTGRPYNLHDERLNLKLGRHLSRLGIEALPMDFLAVEGEDLTDFPRMYWGLGARILRTAKLIRRHSDWYGLHLTNFSCGADSFIEHFYRQVLREKPPLILELDEHSAVAGVLTRLEAYRNVVNNMHHRHRVVGSKEGCQGVA